MRIDRAELLARLHLAWGRVRRLPTELLMVLPLALLLFVLVQVPFMPSPDEVRRARLEQASTLVAADGTVLARFTRVHREWRSLDQLPQHLVQALLATEDHRFFRHHGIDLRRTAAAAWRTLRGDRQGGSTLTQQLARNLYPEEVGRAPTLTRKVREALTAIKIEAHATKPEILETYLNTVPFLYNAVGVEMGARTYFGKPAAQLDVLESATLVGMLKGTSYYNPHQNPERSRERRNLVLAQMARQGFLSEDKLQRLQAQPLRVRFQPQDEVAGPAPHLAQHVRGWLKDWAGRHGRDIYADGLVVRTTVHAPLQAAANEAVAAQVGRLRQYAARRNRDDLQAGFLALDPRSGEVRAWVGSADFGQDQYDHVQQARRQPGSTFKPFVYGAAFAQGFLPTDLFVDQPVTIGRGKEAWSPRDGTPSTYQPMTLADGLAYSRNSITVQLMDQVKPRRVAELARDLGVRDSELDPVPSLALGTSPVTLKEMVTAYAAIANGGRYLAPVIVTQVEDREGRVLEQFRPQRAEPALGENESLMLVDALRGVIDRGTGRAIRDRFGIRADVAGKTGTTQDNTDGWFLLMHPQLVAGAWVGFNDARITMGDRWGQGASSALPIVGAVFQDALAQAWIDPGVSFGRPVLPQRQPPGNGWWAQVMGANEAPPQQVARVEEPPPVRAAPRVREPRQDPGESWLERHQREREAWERRLDRRDEERAHARERERERWAKWQDKQAKAWQKEWKQWRKERKNKGKRKD